jgi:hypothetical protein
MIDLRSQKAPGSLLGVMASLCLLAFLLSWVTSAAASSIVPSGDPGGHVLRQLTPTAKALPGYGTSALPWTKAPVANAAYITAIEPFQDSCDGKPATRGWSQVVVQSSFKWASKFAGLFGYVGGRLAGLGWHREHLNAGSADHEAMWWKTLTSGKKAVAQLTTSPIKDWWEFVVTAAPVGKPVRGC